MMSKAASIWGLALALSATALAAHPESRGGRHYGRPAGAPAGSPAPRAPDLTTHGRFVHGPAYGHRPDPRASDAHPLQTPHARPRHPGRRFIAAPLIFPGYYPYGAPWPSAPPPDETPAPPVAYAPPPPPAIAPPAPPVIEPAPVTSAPATPIYYCAETRGYTNDLTLMQCPGPWQRVSP